MLQIRSEVPEDDVIRRLTFVGHVPVYRSKGNDLFESLELSHDQSSVSYEIGVSLCTSSVPIKDQKSNVKYNQ
jgi:hypothetical protein